MFICEETSWCALATNGKSFRSANNPDTFVNNYRDMRKTVPFEARNFHYYNGGHRRKNNRDAEARMAWELTQARGSAFHAYKPTSFICAFRFTVSPISTFARDTSPCARSAMLSAHISSALASTSIFHVLIVAFHCDEGEPAIHHGRPLICVLHLR